MDASLPIIDINTPIKDILDAKIAYHQSRLAFHQSQIEDLNKLKKSVNGNGWASLTILPPTVDFNQVQHIRLPDWSKFDFTRKVIKPLVIDFLTKNPHKYTSQDILEYLQPPLWEDKETRTQYIATISQTLGHLVELKMVNKIEQKGKSGNLYEIKKT